MYDLLHVDKDLRLEAVVSHTRRYDFFSAQDKRHGSRHEATMG
jgi:hypothetical protein